MTWSSAMSRRLLKINNSVCVFVENRFICKLKVRVINQGNLLIITLMYLIGDAKVNWGRSMFGRHYRCGL